MLTLRGHVKVLDFGVAKMARGDEASPNGDWNVEALTAVGGVVGSGPYMSPEQIAGGDVNPRSDVFSLGVVIYQMATRQLPFAGTTRAELTQSILQCDPGAHHTAQSRDPIGAGTDYVQVPRQECRRPLSIGARAVDRPVAVEAPGGCEGTARDADHRCVPRVGSIRAGCPRLGASALGVFLRGLRRCVRVWAATVIDPTYAGAYAGLALAKIAQATNRNVLVEAFGEAKAAALRALALDDESADARVALGQVMVSAEWDWIAAERSFQRALALNPNHAEAYLHYGVLKEALGDLERGFSLKMQGLECDSTSALAHVLIAVSFWNQRRYDDVVVWANKALDRDPQHHFAREVLGGAYWKMGDLARAGELLSNGTAYAELGIAGFKLAVQCAEAGDLDAAFEHLQRLIDARDPALIHLAVAPQWDSLRADPRFNQCLARMKLRPVGTVSGPMPESR